MLACWLKSHAALTSLPKCFGWSKLLFLEGEMSLGAHTKLCCVRIEEVKLYTFGFCLRDIWISGIMMTKWQLPLWCVSSLLNIDPSGQMLLYSRGSNYWKPKTNSEVWAQKITLGKIASDWSIYSLNMLAANQELFLDCLGSNSVHALQNLHAAKWQRCQFLRQKS